MARSVVHCDRSLTVFLVLISSYNFSWHSKRGTTLAAGSGCWIRISSPGLQTGWFSVDLLTVVVPLALTFTWRTCLPLALALSTKRLAIERMGVPRARVLRLVKLGGSSERRGCLSVGSRRLPQLCPADRPHRRLCLGNPFSLVRVYHHTWGFVHVDVDSTWVGSQLYGLCNPDVDTTRLVRPGPLAGCESLSTERFYLAALSGAS